MHAPPITTNTTSPHRGTPNLAAQRSILESADSSQPVLTRGKIAPFRGIRKLLERNQHVDATSSLASEPAGVNHNNKNGKQPDVAYYEPPSGPPPARSSTITAADGTSYSESQLHHLVGEVKDYQLTHGSLLKLVRFETESSVPARPVGVSILPTEFPRVQFEEALQLQHAFNELYIRVASDPEWLYSVLESAIKSDDFIAALWDVYVQVRDAGALQDVVCAVFRSDYMLHQPSVHEEPQLKQVEINTFSCAGACHAERIANMHRHLAPVRGIDPSLAVQHLPENHNTQAIVKMLKLANDTYLSTEPPSRPTCILITVQPNNFNIADERPIQYGLQNDSSIPCFRCEWQTVLTTTTLTADRTLLYRPPLGNLEFEVSVIYYRGGYEAGEYRAASKLTRLRLEMSRAVKSPDILTHLTTCKSVQQALSVPGALERFLPSAADVERVRRTFMPMSILDTSPAGLEARAIAQDERRVVDYVLKPNRDGGGHNLYRADIPAFLAGEPEGEWGNYVLMRLIEAPRRTQGTLMMMQDLWSGDVVSELGVVGTMLFRRSAAQRGGGGADGAVDVEMLLNEAAGWTFKTKPRGIDEMSVVKGYGCFDCPWLVW